MPFVPALRTATRIGRKPLARTGLVLMVSAAAFTLAACGGSATPSGSGGSAPSGAAQAGGPGTPPGAFGSIASVAASSIEVQNKTSGQVTVNFGSSTTFTNEVSGTLADVTVGSCVTVSGTGGSGQPVAARSVSITKATSGGCTAAAGGRGGGGGNGTRPSGSNRPRPTGTNGGRFGGAFGTVGAVTGASFTVHTTPRGSTAATDVTVNVSGTTTYTKSESATSSALVVGQCAAALGTTDDTGAVTAKSITISKPGTNGCSTGFGRGGFGGGNGGGNG